MCRRRPKVLQCRFMQGRSPIFSMNSPRLLRKKCIFRCNFPLFLLFRYHIFRTDTSPLSVVVFSFSGPHDVLLARLYRSVANVERSLRSRQLLGPILFCYMLSSVALLSFCCRYRYHSVTISLPSRLSPSSALRCAYCSTNRLRAASCAALAGFVCFGQR